MKRRGKIGLLLAAAMLCLSMLCPAVFAAEQRVFDQAGLFSGSDISKLEATISELREKWGMDFVVVTTDDAGGKSARDYADDYYDYNGFGVGADNSGVLFLIDMDNREAYISTTGSAIDIYTDARIEKMLDSVFRYLPDGAYYRSAAAFLKEADAYARKGVPDNHYRDDGTTRYDTDEEVSALPVILGAIAVGLIAGGAIFLVVFLKYNRKGKTTPYPFRQQSTMQLLRNEDVFIRASVTSRHIDTSSHGSSGGGGSSIHVSSSGTSHGGGGRSF